LPLALSLAARAQSNYPVPYTFTTLAGPSRFALAMGGTLAANVGSADGTGTSARFSHPRGVAVDNVGNVYVADNFNSTIRKVTPAGVVTTVARELCLGVAVDSAGNIYAVGPYNTIRKLTPAGVVTTLAGLAGSHGSADGTGSAARFFYPDGVAVDSAANVYVTDSSNSTIRRVTPSGVVTTLAGLAGSHGSADGTGTAARFNEPTGVAVDSAGNVYVTDLKDSTIRKVTPAGVVTTLAGLAGSWGSADGTGSAARFFYPDGVAVDSAANVYVTDSGNSTIRRVTPSGVVTTLAGLAGLPMGHRYADGTGRAARFQALAGVAVDSSGNIYVADPGNNNIRKGFVQK
jgi:sugar lactone lactonase YvrE